MFRRGDHIGTKITVYSPLLMSFLFLNMKISGLNPDMFMFYFIRLLLLPVQGGNERIINLHLHTCLQRVMGKFTPVHLFAMSDAPCWQNECKFTKGKRERNASYLEKYLFATNKTYNLGSASQNLSERHIHKFQCEM